MAAINQLGRQLGIRTVAEHASSDPIVGKLRELGVDYAQGYAFGHPRPLSSLADD